MKDEPTVNEEWLAIEEWVGGKDYMKPFHLEHTRTTFFKIVKLGGWEHAKLEFFDGGIPLASCYMVNVTENDIKQMMKALALMLKRMEREKE